jgi:molybdenum cofactor biosynthesis enzyme MoaA
MSKNTSEEILFMKSKILKKLTYNGKTISDAIEEKKLYFRVSLVGTCNLNCEFCHNEGAPYIGKLDLSFGLNAIKNARLLGFKRIQFTGGEPLLHSQVIEFVHDSKQIFSDVGITTNGILLKKFIYHLSEAGITRIHVSLQIESLIDSNVKDRWKVPNWLEPILEYSKTEAFTLRLNLPVPHNKLKEATMFLKEIAPFQCSIKLFSVLPSNKRMDFSYPLNELAEVARSENMRRNKNGCKGKISVREYFLPKGFRCQSCASYSSCRELSRSLRLGADGILRPCLATRKWDSPLNEKNMLESIEDAALFALDF